MVSFFAEVKSYNPTKYHTSQSVSQSDSQSVSQSISQSVNQSINQSMILMDGFYNYTKFHANLLDAYGEWSRKCFHTHLYL